MPYHDEPNWEDVRWDHRASDEAGGTLQRTASAIERALADDAYQATLATAEWRGPSYAEFQRRWRALCAELSELASACRAAAESVQRASARAAEEQRRRERERAVWERDEERRRRDRAA